MSNHISATPSTRAEAFIPAMFSQASTPHTENAAPASAANRETVCAKDFLQDAREPERRIPNSVGNDMRRAAAPAAPAGASSEAMGDVRKTLSDILEVMVAPAEQKNEARLAEILTLIESHRRENEQNFDQLARQFIQLTLALHGRTKTAINRLDHRLDEFGTLTAQNREQDQERLTARLTGLAEAADVKINSVTGSIDARISLLSAKINGDVNKTIAELGRAISEFGTALPGISD